MPDPTLDGRTGRVPAGCVFWVHAVERTFTTQPEDHGNCSVGSLTHGLIDLATAATKADVGALVEAGWVTPEIFPSIPRWSPGPLRSPTDRWSMQPRRPTSFWCVPTQKGS